MMFDLVVRNGTVVTSAWTSDLDIGIRDGRIVALGPSLGRGTAEIDASGLRVLPGGVDVHTHLDSVQGGIHSADDFESGTAAAAAGGITTICDYARQSPDETMRETLEIWRTKARGRAHVDYAFHLILQRFDDATFAEIPVVARAGFPSFKVFTMGDHRPRDVDLIRLMAAASSAGAVVSIHAEDSDILDLALRRLEADEALAPRFFPESRPALAEAKAVGRVIHYADLTQADVYLVHLSTADAVAAVRDARQRGVRVWAETRPIYLAMTEDQYGVNGAEAANLVAAPPLRTPKDVNALWTGLCDGVVSVIASDHCAWTREQKGHGSQDFRRARFGVPSLESELVIVYSEGVATGRISEQVFVAAFATNPARIFGLYPRKGTIAVGSDADLAILDPARVKTIDGARAYSRAGYDPFDGRTPSATIAMTISRGEVIAKDGRVLSSPGRGELVTRRSRSGPW